MFFEKFCSYNFTWLNLISGQISSNFGKDTSLDSFKTRRKTTYGDRNRGQKVLNDHAIVEIFGIRYDGNTN